MSRLKLLVSVNVGTSAVLFTDSYRCVHAFATGPGICGSDLHVLRCGWGESKFPAIVGHEVSYTLVSIGGGRPTLTAPFACRSSVKSCEPDP
jgi:hypothetical protein